MPRKTKQTVDISMWADFRQNYIKMTIRSGNFFAYEEKSVVLTIMNNIDLGQPNNNRDTSPGLHITIKTIDDSALYQDFPNPISNQLFKILAGRFVDWDQSNNLPTVTVLAKRLESLIGEKSDYCTS